MSDAAQRSAYERFAAETYATFHGTIKGAVQAAPRGQDVLVVVGDDHADTPFRTYFIDPSDKPEDREPALAGAFSQISALEAAVRVAGKDGVKLSIELDEAKLKFITDAIRNNDGNVPPEFQPYTMFHTIAYAMKHDIPIVPNDPLHETAEKEGDDINNEERERALIRGIISTADKHDQKTSVVVHVGGVAHLSNMLGYTDQEVIDAGGKIEAQGDRNPFNGTYASAHYFNPIRFSPTMMDVSNRVLANPNEPPDYKRQIASDLAEHTFFTNPKNATQIDTPGAMPDDVKASIAEMVQEAARKHEEAVRAPSANPAASAPVSSSFCAKF